MTEGKRIELLSGSNSSLWTYLNHYLSLHPEYSLKAVTHVEVELGTEYTAWLECPCTQ